MDSYLSKKLILLLTLSASTFTIVSSQIDTEETDMNCLRANPNLIDGACNVLNKRIDHTDFSEDDMAKLSALFSTRFNRAHELNFLNPDQIRIVGNGVKKFLNSSKGAEADLFVTTGIFGRKANNTHEVIRAYNNSYNAVLEVNKGRQGPIVGLYAQFASETYETELQAIQAVFGGKLSSRIPIGVYMSDCDRYFQGGVWAVKYFQRLNFITCHIAVDYLLTPELAANKTIQKCNELKRIASTHNIFVEIMCTAKYSSRGISKSLGVQSVSKYIRFWCSIVNAIKQEHSKPKIIMRDAFDSAPIAYEKTDKEAYKSMYHAGWWRRIHGTSFEASAFEEKINDYLLTLPLEMEIKNLSSTIHWSA